MALRDEIQTTKPFASKAVEAYLNLIRTSHLLHDGSCALLKAHRLTAPTYNVLRILRGAGEEGLPWHQVRARMVTRVPDVTRILRKLESRGLVRRERSRSDKRVVRAWITEPGLQVLAALDGPTQALHERQMRALTDEECDTLIDLLTRLRERPAGE